MAFPEKKKKKKKKRELGLAIIQFCPLSVYNNFHIKNKQFFLWVRHTENETSKALVKQRMTVNDSG